MAIVFPFLSGVLCPRCERVLTGVKLLRRGSTRGLLSLGVIGIGPSWERRYRPAVRRLSDRLCIRIVHDPVLSRAQSAAQDTGADVAAGLRQVIEHPGINGVLVLDAGWYGITPAVLACEHHKPAFLANLWTESPALLQDLAEQAQARGVMLVPELSFRHQPATSRLRELIASQLGPVQQISLQQEHVDPAHSPCEQLTCAALVDWCSYVTRRTIDSAEWMAPRDDRVKPHWRITFRPDVRGNYLPAPAEIVQGPPLNTGDPAESNLMAAVECSEGLAILRGATEIQWSLRGAELQCERLDQERTDAEVMLDQFCRRLVGGLIPTAGLGDVAAALGHVCRLSG